VDAIAEADIETSFSVISLITFTRQASRTAEKAIPMKTNVNQSGADTDDVDISHEPLVKFGFDRVTLWIDRPEFPIAMARLKKLCTKIKVHLEQMPYQARWKLRLEIYQPTIECLEVLAKALGDYIAVQLTYVEMACDFPGNGKKQTREWRNAFLGAAKMKYQRQPVVRDKNTFYYGRRTDENGNKRGNVLAVYADRHSKILNARPVDGTPPCLHLDWRASGSAPLESHGIITIQDLINFNHPRFWSENIKMYELPKPTEFGRLLSIADDVELKIGKPAMRKRARKFKDDNRIGEIFIMHNALLGRPDNAKRLKAMQFEEWIKTLLQ